jgi:hypothetical protein
LLQKESTKENGFKTFFWFADNFLRCKMVRHCPWQEKRVERAKPSELAI